MNATERIASAPSTGADAVAKLNELLLEANEEGQSWSSGAWRLWFVQIVDAVALHTSETGNRISAIDEQVGSLQRALAASEQARHQAEQYAVQVVMELERVDAKLETAEQAKGAPRHDA